MPATRDSSWRSPRAPHGRGGPPLFDTYIDVDAAHDPVAAVLAAHAAGRPIALRTSGSTGQPRAILRSTASWFDSFPIVAALTGLTASSRVWLPGPLASTMNLFAAVLARSTGAALVGRLEDATHAHLTPLALKALLDRGWDLGGRHLTVAGAALAKAVHDQATGWGARVSHYYGAAELSFVGWGAHAANMSPFPGVEIDIRDGEIWARSPYLCSGYVGPGAAGGGLRRGRDGFATIGDRGRVSGDRLTVRGRGDAVLTGAATVRTADVEHAIRDAIAGDVVVLGQAHETLGEVVAAVLTDAGDYTAARAAAREQLDPTHRPRLWFHVPALPAGPGGKVDRVRLATSLSTAATRLGAAGGLSGVKDQR